MIVYVPGFSETPVVLDSLVELVDLFPTLVDLTKITESLKTCPKNHQDKNIVCTEGRSMVPLMAKSVNGMVSINSIEHCQCFIKDVNKTAFYLLVLFTFRMLSRNLQFLPSIQDQECSQLKNQIVIDHA